MPIPRDPEYTGSPGLPSGFWGEVVALVLTSRHYRGACNELDPDDLLQEILIGVLVRQRGRGAFDRRRASLSSYVHLVTYSVTANQLDKHWRRNRRDAMAQRQEWARPTWGAV